MARASNDLTTPAAAITRIKKRRGHWSTPNPKTQLPPTVPSILDMPDMIPWWHSIFPRLIMLSALVKSRSTAESSTVFRGSDAIGRANPRFLKDA